MIEKIVGSLFINYVMSLLPFGTDIANLRGTSLPLILKSMKNIRSLILAAVLASPAFAITWNVGGVYSGSPLQFLNDPNETYTSPGMSLTTGGFNPALHVLTSATASFWFADDDSDGAEYVDIFVNGVLVSNDLEVNGSHPEANFEKHTFSITDAGTLATLAAGGSITVAVKQQGGDTYLKIVGLTGTGTTRPPGGPGVPDGGSAVAMLGLGLLGLVGAGRLFKR